MDNNGSIAGKFGDTLFLFLFGLLFFGFGAINAAPELVSVLGQWHQARAYVATPASVQSAQLHIERDETVTENVRATFAYRYRGRAYTSDKVSVSGMSDNFDSYHRTVHARLAQAKAAGETVTIWVDPAHPEQALYDRSFRWQPVLFMLPFALLFPAIGLAAWWGIWFLWRGKREPAGDTNPRELRAQSSPGRMAPLAMTAIAFFWNMVSWPPAILLIAQAHAVRQYWAYLAALFPLVGLWLAWMAGSLWRARWRIGQPMLELLHMAHGANFPLRGRVHFFPPFATRAGTRKSAYPVRLVVKLQETAGTGEDAVDTTLWECCALETVLARGATGIDFSIALPAAVAPSDTMAPVERAWLVELQALDTVIGFELR